MTLWAPVDPFQPHVGHLQNSIIDIFEPVQELEQFTIADSRPYSKAQLVDFGVAIISNTHDFEMALLNCHSLATLDQT